MAWVDWPMILRLKIKQRRSNYPDPGQESRVQRGWELLSLDKREDALPLISDQIFYKSTELCSVPLHLLLVSIILPKSGLWVHSKGDLGSGHHRKDDIFRSSKTRSKGDLTPQSGLIHSQSIRSYPESINCWRSSNGFWGILQPQLSSHNPIGPKTRRGNHRVTCCSDLERELEEADPRWLENVEDTNSSGEFMFTPQMGSWKAASWMFQQGFFVQRGSTPSHNSVHGWPPQLPLVLSEVAKTVQLNPDLGSHVTNAGIQVSHWL